MTRWNSAVGLCGLLPNWFYEVNRLQKWISDKTQLSCIYHVNLHDEYIYSMFLQVSCSRLIQPVEVYINWYIMWYLKKDMFCREHIIFDWCIIFWTVCPSSIFGWSGHHLLVGHLSIIQLTHSTSRSFMCSVHAVICLIHTMFWQVRGLISWPHSMILFVGPGFNPLTS